MLEVGRALLRFELRYLYLRNYLPRSLVEAGPLYAGEKLPGRYLAPAVFAVGCDCRVHRHQYRRGIGRGRGVADVAGHRPLAAYLA
ncbi:hypothetical protein SDC9_113344 [bioreactor metagenome]|uniref:Uncharacterized protein n=1 Tax=bioreactor metagenome TaxID=1076179 RepID=A0A645BMH5_9ZZZZ